MEVENKIQEEEQESFDEPLDDGDLFIKEGDVIEEELNIINYHRGMSVPKKIMVIFAFLFVIALIAVGVFFLDKKGFFSRFKKAPEASIVSLNDSIVLQNKVAPKEGIVEAPKVDKKVDEAKKTTTEIDKKVDIAVLNGGTVSGVAGKMKSFLADAGYANVTTKNASSSDYSGVKIFYGKDELEDDAKELSKLITKNYSNVSASKAKAADEKIADIVVIVGK